MILLVTLVTAGIVISSRTGGETAARERFTVPALSMPGAGAGLASDERLVQAAPLVVPSTAITDAVVNPDSPADTSATAEASDEPSNEPVDTADAVAGGDPSLLDDEIITAVPVVARPVAIPYEVQPGDTVGAIAQRFDLSMASVLYANPDIVDPSVLIVGQQMTLPGEEGLIYSVKLGDTIRSIAREFAVKPETIVGYPGNNLIFNKELSVGTHILVPGVTPALPEVIATPEPTEVPIDSTPMPTDTALPTDTAVPTDVPTDTPVPTETPAPPTPDPTRPPQSDFGFAWPIYGPISSYFGPSHPLGIDIDLYGRDGAGIGASALGTVIFAGGDRCCSYGLYVIVQHAKGWATLYAHLSGIAVSVGQDVGHRRRPRLRGKHGLLHGDAPALRNP